MQNELEAKILAIRQKNLPTQVENAPQEIASVSDTITEEPAKAAPVEVPKEQPEPQVTEPEVVSVNWDDSTEEEPIKPTTTEIDFSHLGSALELGEVKTQEEFIAKTSELKSKLKKLEDDAYSGLDDEFKEVIKATKSGVNWRDTVAELLVDYSKLDPVQLYEDEFLRDAVRNPKYQTEGRYDEGKALAALDLIPDAFREQMGKQLQNNFTHNQRLKQQELRQKAEAKAALAEKALAQAANNLSELLPLDTYGIKFEQKHSAEIYQGITSSKLTKKHLGMSYQDLINSGADMKAVVRSITLAEKGEKMIKFKADNSKNQAKAEILKKTQNVQLNTSGQRVSPEEPEKQVVGTAEKLKAHLASQKKGL
jgi:hypothetical protein